MNQPVKPTLRQRILATDWLPFGFGLIWTVGFVALVVWKIRPSVDMLSQPGDLLYVVFALGVAGLLGWLTSFIPMWLTFGPILYHQSLLNGGPFVPGDTVMIITGPHRGRISHVYGGGQHGALRVEISGEERRQYTDFFPANQLLRVTPVLENVTTSENEPALSAGC